MNKNISSTLNAKIILEDCKKNGIKIYNYGLGENPIEQPEYYVEMMQKFAHKKQYAHHEGIPELNTTLKDLYNTKDTKYEILVGNGLKELLFIIQLAFEGKIIHITPSWVSYKEQIHVLKKENDLIEFETFIDDNFRINLPYLEDTLQMIQNKPKLLLFNNPNNPTGIAYNNNEIEQVAKIIKKYNCWVFADEIYLNLCYQEKVKSISEFIPELTIIGSSVSKDLGCGGYRLGWLAFPENLNEFYNKCAQLSSNIYSCASVPTQYATNKMLLNKELYKNHYVNSSNIYHFITTEMCNILQKSKLKYVKPNAAWYMLINFEAYKKELNEINIFDGIELSNFLLEKLHIISVAGEHFNINGLNIRFSFIDFKYNMNQDEKIDISNMTQGFKMLVDFLHSLK